MLGGGRAGGAARGADARVWRTTGALAQPAVTLTRPTAMNQITANGETFSFLTTSGTVSYTFTTDAAPDSCKCLLRANM